jgi:hypothetical protein
VLIESWDVRQFGIAFHGSDSDLTVDFRKSMEGYLLFSMNQLLKLEEIVTFWGLC